LDASHTTGATRAQALQARVRALELENAALYEDSAVGYITIDATGAIEQCNGAAAALLGWQAAALRGRQLASFVERLDVPALLGFCERARSDGAGSCDLTLGGDAPALRVVRFSRASLVGESCCRLALSDVTAHQQANDALQRSESRLRHAYRRLAQAQESERVRLTEQLHDQVGRNLTALGLHLAMLSRDVVDDPSAATLREATTLLQATVAQVRHLMSELYPPMLGDYGVYSAVRWWASEVARRTGAEVRMVENDGDWRLRPEAEAALFRITQEALENAVRHAAATRIEVTLRAVDRRIELIVEDDGRGFDCTTVGIDERSSWGLTLMRERALAIGATLDIDSRPGRGTRIHLEVERLPR
jgi:signal transduction histidine kinase